MEAAYQDFFASFTGTVTQIEAYRELDRVRLALLEGRFDAFEQHLTTFDEILGANPG